jgi:hypothetical protein
MGVRDEEAFIEMKEHILDMDGGIGEVTLFVLGNTYGDCIAIEEQPTVYKLRIREIAQLQANSSHDHKTYGPTPGHVSYAESPLKLGLRYQFDNPISCLEHAIPLSRLTLERLTGFRTLIDFFSKPPLPPRRTDSDFSTNEVHLHAYGSQHVTNFGGDSWLNLWNPTCDFSIS